MERNSSWQHNLKRERQLRGWSQEDVAARIGSDPRTVGRWERGLTFPSPYFQQRLVDLFGKDAEALGFIAEQGENLNHAPTDSYHLLSNQDSEEAPHIDNDGEGPVTVAWPPNLPDEPYYPLPGRERDLHNLLAVLQDPQGALVITIDGLAGLGKTALAVELTRRALHQGLFNGIIGDSAKQELFAGGEIVKVNEATLDFDALLDTIARQRRCARRSPTKPARREPRHCH
jgi:transcriptional regulator with XRE-family HTH domain